MSAPAAPLGRLVRGPSALGTDPRRLWHLTRTLAVTDFKLKFFGSALGYLWQLMKPLMIFGILYVIFSVALKFGGPERFYPQALLLGIVFFNFFSEATGGAVTSLVNREALVRKVEFPRLAVPLSVVLTALFNFALNLIPVLVFLLLAGARIRWEWLEIIPLTVLLTVFSLGIAMFVSALYVRYRDVAPIWDVVLQAMFYASLIFFTVETVREQIGNWVAVLELNPVAAIIQQARHALIDPSHPSIVDAMNGHAWYVLGPLLLVAFVAAGGYLYFDRAAPRIAEDL